MSHLRFTLDLAVKMPIPSALQTKLQAIKDRIKELKAFAEKINSEENTIRATYHICHHDEGKPCEPEQEI